ncbi:MAG: hypothetical protein ABI772_08225 [Bacteroidota bacterium]
MKSKITLIIITTCNFIISSNFLFAQCSNQVTHLTGTTTVNGVNVSVSSTGFTSDNSTYCASTIPYFVGYNVVSGNGMYTFNFSPSINSLTLNFSGISNGGIGQEIVLLYINGTHYSIPSAGIPNNCDAMATLTPTGDITGCASCGVSGWNGTTISGNISSFSIVDSAAWGQGNGALFSLFICNSVQTGIDQSEANSSYQLFPNPFSLQTTLQTTGQFVKQINNISGQEVILLRDNLSSGLYFIRLTQDSRLLTAEKLVIID